MPNRSESEQPSIPMDNNTLSEIADRAGGVVVRPPTEGDNKLIKGLNPGDIIFPEHAATLRYDPLNNQYVLTVSNPDSGTARIVGGVSVILDRGSVEFVGREKRGKAEERTHVTLVKNQKPHFSQ